MKVWTTINPTDMARLLLFRTVFLVFLASQVSAETDNRMSFHFAATGGNCHSCAWIAAQGIITEDTHQDFLAFLSSEGLLGKRGLTIHLNSPGGSLLGGVYLGLAIRSQQANTVVSGAHVHEIYDDGLRIVTSDPPIQAECSSACVFAFAGGVTRIASQSTPAEMIGFQQIGRLGVHQFYTSEALDDPKSRLFTAEDRIADQQIISLLLAYLSTMDVSAELLQIAAMTDPRSIHYLSEDELRRTQIDNWMVNDVYLTGYRNGVAVTEITYRRPDADYRLELYCDDGEARMLATIDSRGLYDVESHRRWKLYENVTLTDGGGLELIEQNFTIQPDGGVRMDLLFRVLDPITSIIGRKEFRFSDASSRHNMETAAMMSFSLPPEFDGLYLLPRACLG